jgi:hypothetical protein
MKHLSEIPYSLEPDHAAPEINQVLISQEPRKTPSSCGLVREDV